MPEIVTALTALLSLASLALRPEPAKLLFLLPEVLHLLNHYLQCIKSRM